MDHMVIFFFYCTMFTKLLPWLSAPWCTFTCKKNEYKSLLGSQSHKSQSYSHSHQKIEAPSKSTKWYLYMETGFWPAYCYLFICSRTPWATVTARWRETHVGCACLINSLSVTRSFDVVLQIAKHCWLLSVQFWNLTLANWFYLLAGHAPKEKVTIFEPQQLLLAATKFTAGIILFLCLFWYLPKMNWKGHF